MDRMILTTLRLPARLEAALTKHTVANLRVQRRAAPGAAPTVHDLVATQMDRSYATAHRVMREARHRLPSYTPPPHVFVLTPSQDQGCPGSVVHVRERTAWSQTRPEWPASIRPVLVYLLLSVAYSPGGGGSCEALSGPLGYRVVHFLSNRADRQTSRPR